mgnify:FL=1
MQWPTRGVMCPPPAPAAQDRWATDDRAATPRPHWSSQHDRAGCPCRDAAPARGQQKYSIPAAPSQCAAANRRAAAQSTSTGREVAPGAVSGARCSSPAVVFSVQPPNLRFCPKSTASRLRAVQRPPTRRELFRALLHPGIGSCGPARLEPFLHLCTRHPAHGAEEYSLLRYIY